MPPTPDEFRGARVGLRAVAQAAGVSVMTASLAVRDSPRLSPETRQRVRALAEKIGYRPDPEIARLMTRLRPSRMTQGSVIIAMIDLHRRKKPEVHPYDDGVRRGIVERARRNGYGATLFSLSSYGGSLKRLMHVIHSRGITGVILLPSSEPVELEADFDWHGISVVAATSTVISPQFHQVSPNHLHNIRMILDHLRARRYERPLAIFNASLDRRTHHVYSMVLSCAGHGERIVILPDELSDAAAAARVEAALIQHDPDVLLGGDAMMRLMKTPRLARLGARRDHLTLTSNQKTTLPYLDQRPELIGECAVSLVTGMMHNHETGIPAAQQVTVIRGTIHEPSTAADATLRGVAAAERR